MNKILTGSTIDKKEKKDFLTNLEVTSYYLFYNEILHPSNWIAIICNIRLCVMECI